MEHIDVDDIVKKFHEDVVYYETNDSDISKFYAGKSVFLTGGTGFLGKLIVEKLLRACPNIESIYMLVRSKKGKDKYTRADELFNDVLFKKLLKLQPNCREKIYLVDGDVSLPNLGMSYDDRKLLTERVSMIIHSAATVRFTERLCIAIDINIKGTKEMIRLAKECKGLLSFVHISTAYCHSINDKNIIDEKFYDVKIPPENIIDLRNALTDEVLDDITPVILGEYINSYSFTKAATEEYIRKNASELPLSIVRPAIVMPTYQEPIRAWTDNVNGPSGLIIGVGFGILRLFLIEKASIAHIVPGDMTANLIIAASYKTAIERRQETPIYNFTASEQNNVSWGVCFEQWRIYGRKTPPIKCMWRTFAITTTNIYLYYFLAFFLHSIPGYFIDNFLQLIGKKTLLMFVYQQINKIRDSFAYYSSAKWRFNCQNTFDLYDGLSKEDKKLFFFDMRKINWTDIMSMICIGLRTYLVKDDLNTIPQARRKHFWLSIAHYSLIFSFLAVLAYLLSYLWFC